MAVPAFAQLGEIYARFRLSESASLGPVGDATSGEVEDYRVFIANNPFQNPSLQHDVNASGAVTPLDALQIINALGRADIDVSNGSLDLSAPPLPAGLPTFPDVDGNGLMNSLDALLVINRLAELSNLGELESVGEGESVGSFVPLSGGIMASIPTAVGDRLIAETISQPVSTIREVAESKTSVFDAPEVVQLDSIVDSLAQDAATAKDSSTAAESLDRVFAEL